MAFHRLSVLLSSHIDSFIRYRLCPARLDARVDVLWIAPSDMKWWLGYRLGPVVVAVAVIVVIWWLDTARALYYGEAAERNTNRCHHAKLGISSERRAL